MKDLPPLKPLLPAPATRTVTVQPNALRAASLSVKSSDAFSEDSPDTSPLTTPSGARPTLPGSAAARERLPYVTSAPLLLAKYAHAAPRDALLDVARDIVRTDARFVDNDSPYLQPLRGETQAPLDPRAEALRHHIASDLVGLAKRPHTQVTIDSGRAEPTVFTQRCVHMAVHQGGPRQQPVWSTQYDFTPSSIAAKGDHTLANEHLRCHAANSAFITAGDRLVAFRSARTDTLAKLEAKLTGACSAALSAAQGDKSRATGWRRTVDGWEFQAVIVTAMDHSFLKHLVGLVQRLFFGGERHTERARLRAMRQAQKAFGQPFARGRPYVIEVDGERHQVTIAPPQIIEVVMSGCSKSPSRIREARERNVRGACGLALQLKKQWQQAGESAAAHLVQQVLLASAAGGTGQLLESVAYSEKLAALPMKQRLSMEWLHLQLHGRTSTGRILLGKTDPGIEALLLWNVLAEARVASGIECKSGVDRTLTLAALFATAHCLDLRQSAYDPLAAQPQEHRAVSDAFTHFADVLGKPVVQMVRGPLGRIKWARHPVARHWYNLDKGTLLVRRNKPATLGPAV